MSSMSPTEYTKPYNRVVSRPLWGRWEPRGVRGVCGVRRVPVVGPESARAGGRRRSSGASCRVVSRGAACCCVLSHRVAP
ncbi:unnamed protein product [Colias eurytheme]|nr:unnamed protein product [Colias eurytheme]